MDFVSIDFKIPNIVEWIKTSHEVLLVYYPVVCYFKGKTDKNQKNSNRVFFIIATPKKGSFAYKTLEEGAGSLYNDLSNLSFVYFCGYQRIILYIFARDASNKKNKQFPFVSKVSKVSNTS